MLFNSFSFIFLFLPITFAGTFVLARYNHFLSALWLALASLTFYGIWDSRFLFLLIGSILFNYSAGYWIGINRPKNTIKTKVILIMAIIGNLTLLAYFKYINFFISSTNHLFNLDIPLLNIILPLGISFFTFTQIAFLVDTYRGVAHEYKFNHYLLFVTYFPHLIAGPILHHKQMMPQFSKKSTYEINSEHIAVGLTIFVLGLSKKVLIADNLSEFVTPVFNAARDGQVLMLLEAWVGALAYSLQLYFDFSGYSDMAIGLSLMFNVRLPINFNSPYKATNIIDFWRRWHMTLSTFLRDYLYIPLGGNRHGKARRYLNLMVTMLLGGLWHGAGLTFIVWGGLHGLYLMINQGWREIKSTFKWNHEGRIAEIFFGLITFIAVTVAWVFFRADNLSSAQSILMAMLGQNGLMHKFVPIREALKVILPCLVIIWLLPNVQQIMKNYKPTWNDINGNNKNPVSNKKNIFSFVIWQPKKIYAIAIGTLFLWNINNLSKVSEFLYFQF